MTEIVKHESLSEQSVAEGFNVKRMGANDLMSIQQWTCEPDASFPEHSHPHQQIGYVYNGGEITLWVEGEKHILGPGDTYFVRGNETHAGTNHSHEAVDGVDVFSPPLKEEDWM